MGSLQLDSTFYPSAHGTPVVSLRLVNTGRDRFSGFRLAFSSFILLTPSPGSDVRLAMRVGTYHELVAPSRIDLLPGGVWEAGTFDCEYALMHSNDGPVRAFLITADQMTVPVRAVATERSTSVRVSTDAPPPLQIIDASDLVGVAWMSAASCERRLHPRGPLVLSHQTGTPGVPVDANLSPSLAREEFCLDTRPDGGWTVEAGSDCSLRWAFMELARRQRDDRPDQERPTRFSPRYGFRGLMLDLSRHYFPAPDVEEVIDLAAWRGLNRLHLHLTDDQAWRMPIQAYPALTEVAAYRGFGLPIPPQNGSAAEVYGGAYTVEDIHRWVDRAGELGLELIPEIDVPGHCYAAIAALPELWDPGDTGTVESPHHFPSNVLNPGLPATQRFMETVFGEVADLFPGPWIHIGGDEVPKGSWEHSPAARSYAAERGLEGHRAVEASFLRNVIRIVTQIVGRKIGAWQEIVDVGAMKPDDGYVLAWQSSSVFDQQSGFSAYCEHLVREGYEVVAAPGHTYYLDMAAGPDWHLPGMWWAGHIDNDVIAAYDPTAGWDSATADRLAGIQAQLWTEHVPDRATLRAMLLPRLDAFGAAGWRTEVGLQGRGEP